VGAGVHVQRLAVAGLFDGRVHTDARAVVATVGQRRQIEHGDDLIDVAVAGSAGDAVIAGQGGNVGVVAEPAQAQHRLTKAGQRPAVLAGTASTAFGVQQPAEVLGQFAGLVEHGTISNHGEPSGPDLIFANPVLPGASRSSSLGFLGSPALTQAASQPQQTSPRSR
jgi:xanthine/CO dehydrogenase XdhC/CoxF family maturation factor